MTDTAKTLYRRLDAVFRKLPPRRSQVRVLESFLDSSFSSLRDDLRLRTGLLYREEPGGFALVRTVGDSPAAPIAVSLPFSTPPVRVLLRHGVYIFPDPNAELSLAGLGLLPHEPSAGVVVGKRPERSLFLFVLGDGWQHEEIDFTLNTVRSALEARLSDTRVRVSMIESAEIQRSLLVDEPPAFAGFDIACHSAAAEDVGGDFYDFHDLGGSALGIAIGDASGHGLPAALLVRDVVTGLRMGIERELKMTHVFKKLNRVIHRSRLSSRFVSVFYGEFEQNGTVVYVNGGHQPPVLFRRAPGGGELELREGGTVIGPLAEPEFRRGIARLEPGDLLVLCTDGLLERRSNTDDFFGLDRMKAVVRAHQHESADTIVSALFEIALAFGEHRPWEDDVTIVVVRRDGNEGTM